MKKITTKLRFIILVLMVFQTSCAPVFPDERIPLSEIPGAELGGYIIAYCWQDPDGKQSINFPENREVVVVVSDIMGEYSEVIKHPISSSASASNLVVFKNGCLSESTNMLRQAWYSLAWRPHSNEITFVEGSDWSISGFNSRSISYTAETKEGEFNDWIRSSKDYFSFPRGLYWSHDGQRLATLGRDVNIDFMTSLGDNIWVASGTPPSFTRITNITEAGDFIANASWSNDAAKLAITYRKKSGIAIAVLDNQSRVQSFIDVTSNQFGELSEYWPYAFTSWFQLIYDRDNIDFNTYVSLNSTPVWVNNDNQIIFTASNSSNQATLFIVASDGTRLESFLPNISGLVFMPRLSVDGRTLAFVRYPNWKIRHKVEIATVDIQTKETSSLVVLYAKNEEDLIISGMNWSLDGKYLMFSSNHAGESDIYVVTQDGQAWKNITADIDGNAVGPVWKP